MKTTKTICQVSRDHVLLWKLNWRKDRKSKTACEIYNKVYGESESENDTDFCRLFPKNKIKLISLGQNTELKIIRFVIFEVVIS